MTAWLSGFKQTILENKLVSFLLFLLLLIVGLLVWQRSTIEYIIETRYQTTQSANRNSMYALELMLSDKGKQADSQLDIDLDELINKLDEFKTNNQKPPVLVINQISSGLSQKKYQLLMTWVQKGGHLITFNGRSNWVSEAKWQPVKNAIANKNEAELDKALEQVHASYENDFLKHINIYKIKPDEADAYIDQVELEEARKELEDSLINLGVDPEDVAEVLAKQEAEQKNNNRDEQNKITDKVKSIMQGPDFALIKIAEKDNHNGKQQLLLLKNRSKTYFNADVFYQKNPQAKPMDTMQTATAKEIRWYLFQQLAELQRKIKYFNDADKANKSSEKNNKKQPSKQRLTANQSDTESTSNNKQRKQAELIKEKRERFESGLYLHTDYFKPQEATKFIKAVLKLSDEDLVKLFAPKNNILIDSHYGKGRLTILSDSVMMSNPRSYHLNKMKAKADNDMLGLNFFSNDYGHLLALDNAVFSHWLMQDAQDVWLFPKVAVDSLPVLIWKKASFALLGFLLLLLVWLCSLFDRFGRIKTLVSKTQHDIMLYFQQIGRYAWSVDQAYHLSKVMHEQSLKLIQNKLAVDLTQSKDILLLQSKLMSLMLNKIKQLNVEVNNNGEIKPNQTDTLVVCELTDQLILQNQQYFMSLLSTKNLQWVLVDAYKDEYQTDAKQFVADTQTFWLLNWILK